MTKYRVSLLVADESIDFIPNALTSVGGAASSGFKIKQCKFKGDYAILAPTAEGISIHPLRGAQGKSTTLRPGQISRLDDLTIFVQTVHDSVKTHTEDLNLKPILQMMTEPENTTLPLQAILKHAMELARHDQGFIISQNLSGDFKMVANIGVESSSHWLSESVVVEATRSQTPLLLQNVVGSNFDTKVSLIATGFLSMFCWPLVVQGQTLGVLVTCSRLPHAGLGDALKMQIETCSHLAAIVLNFHLRELRMKEEIKQNRRRESAGPFTTENEQLLEICELGRKVANSDLSILIQGETGVGKEVFSKWIHDQSDRRGQPFIAVNCGAIPHELLESLLFGHKRGSFTGAHADQIGKIQLAHKGTLFLDEIGDLPHGLQAKLLRMLQEKHVEPVGATKPIPVDVRILCASHKNIEELAEQNLFRPDLYYRLAQMTLWIPPLRDRVDDVRLLARQFINESGTKKILSEDAWQWLFTQNWNGNVRELKSTLQRAILLSDQEIRVEHFKLGKSAPKISAPLKDLDWLGAKDLDQAKQNFIRDKIDHALKITEGNRTRAAELLGVTPRTLFRYLESKI